MSRIRPAGSLRLGRSPRIMAPAVAAGPSYSLQDTFTRADSATAVGTANTGQVHSNAVGVHGISSNKAYPPSAASAENIDLVESSLADGTFSLEITLSATTNRASTAFIFRANDVNNFLAVVMTRVSGLGGSFDLYKRDAGTYTLLASEAGTPTASIVNGSTYTIAVVAAAGVLTVSRDGVTKISHTLSAGNQTKFGVFTKVGFRTYRDGTNDDGGSRYDNLTAI